MNGNKFETLLESYLDGSIGESDRRLLFDVIHHDPAIGAWFETQIDGAEARLDPAASRRMLERIHKAVAHENCQLKRLRLRTLFRKVSKVAAVIALPLAAAFAMWRISLPDEQSGPVEVIVERGQKASVVLPDGSKVWLNSASELSYIPGSWRKERSVSLTGEAYFEVRHDAERPFYVAAGKLNVRVLGTKFNLKAYPDDRMATSTLVEGSVEVATPNGRWTIAPGWQVNYDTRDNITISPTEVDPANYIGWIDNTLVFTDETLEQIVATLQRMYNVEVEFASERIRSRRFSGTLPNTGLIDVLEAVSLSSPISYTIHEGTVRLSEDGRRTELYR